MKRSTRVAAYACSLAVISGCATTSVTERQPYEGGRIARPAHILVYDFAANPADIPAQFGTPDRYAEAVVTQTPQELEVGRKLGARVAAELVEEIQAMGLPAVQAAGGPQPAIGDISIMGYFESVDTGSGVKRVMLGFGSGSADLKTAVEAYLVTDTGLRRLGSGEVDSGGGKTPGLVVPLLVTAATANPIGLVVGGAIKVGGEVTGKDTIEGSAERTAKEIGDQLKTAFQKQGWI